jgi:hypothetical protein
VVARWAQVRPDLDAGVMAEVGRIVWAARLLERAIGASAAEQGLSVPEGDILFTLRRSGEPRLSPSQLSQWLFS